MLTHAHALGYYLVLDEGRVFEKRKSASGQTFTDRVHMKGSKHYEGLAQDTVLYAMDWKPVTINHPVWQELGRIWKTLDPSCTWGGDFEKVDLNHFSWEER